MQTPGWIRGVVLVAFGVVAGIAVDRGWTHAVTIAAAQQTPPSQPQGQGRRNALPTMEQLPAEVAQLKALVPSNSHIMMDVQFHWTNLYFAGRRKNWPLAQYFYNETRNHIEWLIRKSPTTRGPDGKDVDLKGIWEGIDTSSLAMVKAAIEKQDAAQFAATYKTMLESCYACHKSAGRPYLRPMLPQANTMPILNFDTTATWPQ